MHIVVHMVVYWLKAGDAPVVHIWWSILSVFNDLHHHQLTHHHHLQKRIFPHFPVLVSVLVLELVQLVDGL